MAKSKEEIELIITEKPKAAQKVAQALADNKVQKENINTVPVYTIKHKDKTIVVTSAVGHLYTIAEKDSKLRGRFPVFDTEWKPVYEVNKNVKYSQNYIKTLKKIAKQKPKRVIVATDYDIEGEVIGLNVVRFAIGKDDASRMKFSTLTKNDLIKSYDQAKDTLDWGQAKAGETRHTMDWYYGINLSRVLTHFLRERRIYKQMSIGRVQGPALKVLVEKEKEIQAFKSEKFWQIVLNLKKDKEKDTIEAMHKLNQIFDKKQAEDIFTKIKDEKEAIVKKTDKRKTTQRPPTPFDLTTLQTEAYRTLKIKPKNTLQFAQDLYINGYISYPRTSSQQLPESIGYKKIIKQLEKNPLYAPLCKILNKKSTLKPNNGKKDDPAHPAIYPTGVLPSKIEGKEAKLYDLIVKRFLATFGDNAIRESVNVELDVKKEIFISKGVTTLEKGWHVLYEPYTSFKEQPLPLLDEKDKLKITKADKLEKETQPPKRYTESSIIKELEKRNLGTKATRANIVETLYNRKYIEGSPIKATELGIKTIDVLDKYSPLIVDEKLTRQFEDNLELIRQHKKLPKDILEDAKKTIVKIIDGFKKNDKECSDELIEANKIAIKEFNTVSTCPLCKEGKAVIRKGKFGQFLACSNYPDCKYTFNIPNNARNVKETNKECENCGNLLVSFTANRRTYEICINPNCSSNKKKQHHIAEKIGRKCPKCEHDLVMRESIYGKFIACSNYPKCKYTEKIAQQAKKEE